MKKQQITMVAMWALCATLLTAQNPVPPAPAQYNATQDKGAATTDAAEAAAAADAKAQDEYITAYKGIAIQEMDRSGIPASIKLAQAILESNSGQSDLAQAANNHFGIKCTSSWTGKSYEKVDDEKDEDGKPKKSCFRKYGKVTDSYADHSEFLRDPRKYYRYGFLFGLDKKDYRAWARGLESSGYATGAGYADKLIAIIEKYQLYQYDDPETRDANSKPTTPTNRDNDKPNNRSNKDESALLGRVGRVNDVKVVSSRAGETLDDIARTFRISPENVAEYNERRYTPGQPLPTSTRIYIQKKKSKWRGRTSHHFVREGETMFQISQQYGVRLNELLKRNGVLPGQEVATGERVRIKGRRRSSEIVRLRELTASDPTTPGGSKPNKPSTSKPTNSKPTVDDELPEITGNGKQNEPPPPPANRPSTGGTPTPTTPPPPPPPTKPSTGNSGTGTGTNGQSGSWPTTPPSNQPQRDPVPVTPPPANNQAVYHTVVKGDTLFSLQRKYGTPVAKIKSLNGITSDEIKIGQKLRVQ
jgi:flagellum-specific peptidoglycan hydrolase FlgJ/LysM repeat protein